MGRYDKKKDRDHDSEKTENTAAAGAIAGAAAGAVATGGQGGQGGEANVYLPDDYGSDDDVIDSDQINSGDNQSNAVLSKVKQSDDDGSHNDSRDQSDNRTDDDINVDIRDSLNDNGDNRDNDYSQDLEDVGNTDLDVDVAIKDSFRDDDSDDDLIDFDDLGGFEIDSLLADALNGAGNDMAFSLDQTNSLTDNDSVTNPDVIYNGGQPGGAGGDGGEGDASHHHGHPADGGMGGSAAGGFYQTATAKGGIAKMDDFNAGSASGGAGDDNMDLGTMTSADAALTQEAFTQNLTLGANIQYNLAETSVVGGNAFDSGSGNDDAA